MGLVPQELYKEYPFIPKRFSVEDGFMSYLDEGQGPCVLMIHGNPSWSYFFRSLVHDLKKNYRVIAPDHMGMGLSNRLSRPLCLEDRIKHLTLLVRSLGIKKFSLLVHDWGGPIGLGMAMEFASMVEGLIITNTAAYVDSHIPKRINLFRLSLIGDILNRFNLFSLGASFMTANKMGRKGLCWPYKDKEKRKTLLEFVQDIPLDNKHSSFSMLEKVQRGLSLFECPKLILWGGKDFCFNDHFFNRWLSIYPDAKKHYIPTAGHYLFEDAPEECRNVVRNFLDEYH